MPASLPTYTPMTQKLVSPADALLPNSRLVPPTALGHFSLDVPWASDIQLVQHWAQHPTLSPHTPPNNSPSQKVAPPSTPQLPKPESRCHPLPHPSHHLNYKIQWNWLIYCSDPSTWLHPHSYSLRPGHRVTDTLSDLLISFHPLPCSQDEPSELFIWLGLS